MLLQGINWIHELGYQNVEIEIDCKSIVDDMHSLPLYLWGDNTLGKIVSAIGNPIVTDECTASKLRVSYARILVEVDITKELPQEITIRDRSGNKLQQAIKFEWKPEFCPKCQKIGHKCGKRGKTMEA